jgi:hypothetical protein
MPWKRIVLATLIVSAGGVLWAKWQETPSPSSDSFTATEVEAIYEADDPIVAMTRTSTIAVRSDGSYAQLRHFTDPTGGARNWAVRGITDLAAREFISVDPFSESISTYPMTQQHAAQETKRFAGPCAGKSAGKILGFDVLLDQNTENRPEQPDHVHIDKVVRSYWLAPQLRCFALSSEILLYAKGKLTQRTLKTITSLKLGEPPSWVFERPVGYVERAPSEARREAERRYPNHDCCRNASVGAQEDDKFYRQRNTSR